LTRKGVFCVKVPWHSRRRCRTLAAAAAAAVAVAREGGQGGARCVSSG
jgi:hypothetical protein